MYYQVADALIQNILKEKQRRYLKKFYHHGSKINPLNKWMKVLTGNLCQRTQELDGQKIYS